MNLPASLRRPDAAAILVLAAGAATIAAAWSFEIYGGFDPCKLCLQERVPYYVGLPVALAALVAAAMRMTGIARLLLALAAIVFAVGAGLGIHHAGVEWGWWLGPSDCGVTGAPSATVGDLVNQLRNVRIVSCNEASWRFLGLSFAGWNAVMSIGLALVAAWGAGAPRRPA